MSYDQNSDELQARVTEESRRVEAVLNEMGKKIVGQAHVSKRLIMGIVSQGHILLEGLPGLAKTTAIKTLAETTSMSFKRIQFTPDLLPADVIGTQIYDPRTSEFKVRKGPIFANLVLADEINRAPAKVQSALLEAMEERQVTIGESTFDLEEPFLVMATQNPVEQEGTYPLPEAQIDRFMFKVKVGYGDKIQEEEIIRRATSKSLETIQKVVSKHELRNVRSLINDIYVSDKIRKYIVDIVFASRHPSQYGMSDLKNMIEYGASPRASIFLDRAARINAIFEGRTFVTPQDIKDVGMDVLRHRIKPTFEAEAEDVSAEQLVSRIFERVDVP